MLSCIIGVTFDPEPQMPLPLGCVLYQRLSIGGVRFQNFDCCIIGVFYI